jgi:methylmalonyl-CoA mutase N-terminal domain/subunit
MSKNSKPPRTSTSVEPLSRRIVDLKRERAELEEEILQLRAAVQIWAEVYRQTMHTAAGTGTFNVEMH